MGILASLPDYLHTKHLGVDAQFVGAVLLALITLIMPGEVDANLEKPRSYIKQNTLLIASEF